MNVTAEGAPPRQYGESQTRCEQCGSPLAEDQEWCLECGAARTLVHRPPDWRIAAAIVLGVAALVLAGFAIALINLSSEANRSAASTPPPATPAKAATPAAPATPAKAAGAPGIPGWPVGLPGWTVVLFSTTSRQSARATATRLSATGLHVGLLSTSQHTSSTMKPGRWVVFTGRYPTRNAAGARAAALHVKGYRARARRVGLPGR
jgi:hypothetical protein